MKKNKQMKPDNVAKRLWAFFIVLTMCITVQPVVPVKAQEAVQTAARTIYTEFKDGNSTHSGDGSYGNPYNLFEDAYAAAGNGDEISILGSGAFLNAEAAEPFIFDKSVTVNGNGNTFSNRKGGFILNTDVTFKNITLRFSNRLHDAIFANGHKLVLENVTCDSGFRYVVCKSRCDIGFVDNCRNMAVLCGKDNRNRHKSTFGKDNVRFEFAQDGDCLPISF